VFQTDVLRYLVKKVGTGRIMLGSDYPFPIGDPLPRDVVETAEVELGEVDSILGGLASRLFRL
jgi:aminocarboxymuconate-semialdehyde decarboxylase